MVNFEDLSETDKEQLLQQARLIVEQEYINKNATAIYKLKRKELINKNIDEIHKELHIQPFLKDGLRQRYVSIVNYLSKFAICGEYISEDLKIVDSDAWEIFKQVNAIVKDTFISCYALGKE